MSIVKPRILIYILRRDLRLSDNPIFHRASLFPTKRSTKSEPTFVTNTRQREDSITSDSDNLNFTHLLPVYVFPANQVEVSGFLPSPTLQSPYLEARSRVAGLWRTGPHRAKFMAEGVWNLKEQLEGLECASGLEVRVGMVGEVVKHMLEWYSEGKNEEHGSKADVVGIWMTNEDGTEEKQAEAEVKSIATEKGVTFKVWDDVKYYIDDRDLPFDNVKDLPNIYTSFRKSLEPLRECPRQKLPSPTLLPPLPPHIPPQKHPFKIPTSLETLHKALQAPFEEDIQLGIGPPSRLPPNTISAHPFEGGEKAAQNRLSHLVSSGAMSSYKDTRNGMVGLDFSTKLSAYLAQGNLTARQIHWAMVDFEEGKGEGKDVPDYGKGENKGTAAVRFELLWRDYMRLCSRKFGAAMFDVNGIRDAEYHPKERQHPERKRWRYINGTGDGPAKTREVYARFRAGQTGMGLIDASNRELVATGYTSNRARQNVASFLALHLEIDWRIGAEWYEYLLTDYDVGNNWGNWQYVAGVGNDPRQGRVFNPVKQALDYDKQGEYIKAWVPELRGISLTKSVGPSKGQGREEIDAQRLMGLYQAWRLGDWEKDRLGLKGLEWVENPLVRIQFSAGRGRGIGAEGETRGRGRGKGTWRGRGQGFRRMGLEDKASNSV